VNVELATSEVLPGLWVFVMKANPNAHGLVTANNNKWYAHTAHGGYEGATMNEAIANALNGWAAAVTSSLH